MSTLVTTSLRHNTSTSNNVTLDSNGNVGVGTATPFTTANYRSITIQGGSVGCGLSLYDSTGTEGGRFQLDAGQVALFNTTAALPTVFWTNGAERARITSTGLFQFNSGYGSVATAFGCRAWVNFNGTGTVAIRGSGNVSSITDNNVGDYTVNFTTAMPDVNFAVSICTRLAATNTFGQMSPDATEIGTGFVRIKTGTIAGANADVPQAHVAIFR